MAQSTAQKLFEAASERFAHWGYRPAFRRAEALATFNLGVHFKVGIALFFAVLRKMTMSGLTQKRLPHHPISENGLFRITLARRREIRDSNPR
jgi:hypothetical protein